MSGQFLARILARFSARFSALFLVHIRLDFRFNIRLDIGAFFNLIFGSILDSVMPSFPGEDARGGRLVMAAVEKARKIGVCEDRRGTFADVLKRSAGNMVGEDPPPLTPEGVPTTIFLTTKTPRSSMRQSARLDSRLDCGQAEYYRSMRKYGYCTYVRSLTNQINAVIHSRMGDSIGYTWPSCVGDDLHAERIGEQDSVAGGASKTENVEAMLPQFIDNFADRQPAPRDSGDATERHVQRSQLTDDTALWKNMASRKHWVLRGRIPPNIGDSAADIQSFVGEAVNVRTSVVTQLRAISDFDVRAYGPRAEGMVDHLLMVADRLDFLRQALVAVLSVGFSLDSDGDRHCRERVATIDAAFTTASADLRRHTQAKPSNRQYYPALWLRGAGCHERDGKRRSSPVGQRPHAIRTASSSADGAPHVNKNRRVKYC